MNRLKWGVFIALTLLLGFCPTSCRNPDMAIGSKKFTESVILGEMMRLIAKSEGVDTVHHQQLGGTIIVFNGLVNDEIQMYPEYTGTLAYEILKMPDASVDELRDELNSMDIEMSEPLGFNNTYALGMKRSRADELGIEKISDLNRFPQLKLRFGNEFLERGDGWEPLRDHYGLTHEQPVGVDHDVAYRQLDSGVADVIDIYSTDSKVKYYDIRVLEDDREFFPRYDAVMLYRTELKDSHPELVASLNRLVGQLNDAKMLELNSETDLMKRSEAGVAAEFLSERLEVPIAVKEVTWVERLAINTLGHLNLVRMSLCAAILVGIPLGVIAARVAWLGTPILWFVGIVQTIPGLAMLVMLIKPVEWAGMSSLGEGSVPVVIALFLYSLLPIVRNTHAGIVGVSPRLRESAEALGLSEPAKLFRIELPLASPLILAGIKTAAVINVGFATLGALIGAPGYGQPILTGIRLDDPQLILEGAIPAAVLAILVQLMFEGIERALVPRGLKL